MLHVTIHSLVTIAAFLAAGTILRGVGLLDKADAQVGLQAAKYATLPALALQVLSAKGTGGPEAAAVACAAALYYAAVAVLCWFGNRRRRGPERALLTGAAVGVALGTLGLPWVEAAFGQAGVRVALIWDMVNVVAVYGLSYLTMAARGSPPSAVYEHADGGTYRGQWRGAQKQGLGVYAYPGGGRYEGMWRDNLKDGFGVYTFPKAYTLLFPPDGGWYEGEWSAGEREGMGARLMRNGNIKSGRWRKGGLEKRLEPPECALAISSAERAAAAARRVKVGGGTVPDALRMLAMQPLLWAGAFALAMSYAQRPLPATASTLCTPPASILLRLATLHVDAVSAVLAGAHMPLVLLCTGVLLTAPQMRVPQARDAAGVLVARYVPALLAAAGAAYVLQPQHMLPVAAAALCALCPAPAALVDFAHELRLNEGFAAAVVSLSQAASLLLLSALALVASSLVPPPLTTAEAALPQGPPPGPFAIAVCVLAAAVVTTATLFQRTGRLSRGSGSGSGPRNAVRMTLQGELPPAPMPDWAPVLGQVI